MSWKLIFREDTKGKVLRLTLLDHDRDGKRLTQIFKSYPGWRRRFAFQVCWGRPPSTRPCSWKGWGWVDRPRGLACYSWKCWTRTEQVRTSELPNKWKWKLKWKCILQFNWLQDLNCKKSLSSCKCQWKSERKDISGDESESLVFSVLSELVR